MHLHLFPTIDGCFLSIDYNCMPPSLPPLPQTPPIDFYLGFLFYTRNYSFNSFCVCVCFSLSAAHSFRMFNQTLNSPIFGTSAVCAIFYTKRFCGLWTAATATTTTIFSLRNDSQIVATILEIFTSDLNFTSVLKLHISEFSGATECFLLFVCECGFFVPHISIISFNWIA